MQAEADAFKALASEVRLQGSFGHVGEIAALVAQRGRLTDADLGPVCGPEELP